MTDRQKTFARLLATDPLGNKTKAALGAGCPPKSASATATKWLKKAAVKAEIEQIQARTAQKLDISAEKVLAGLAKVAFLDVRKAFNEDGSLKSVHELDDETAGAVAGIEHEKLFEHFGKGQAKHVGTTTKIKFSDRIKALELLGKWNKLKLFTDTLELKMDDAIAQRLLAGRKRVSG
jgi:phage terminase small subunit